MSGIDLDVVHVGAVVIECGAPTHYGSIDRQSNQPHRADNDHESEVVSKGPDGEQAETRGQSSHGENNRTETEGTEAEDFDTSLELQFYFRCCENPVK